MRVCYATADDVRDAVDIRDTARAEPQIVRHLQAGADTIDGELHIVAHPVYATRRFDWPNENQQGTRPWRLWLDSNLLIRADTVVSGGTTLAVGDYILRRSDDRDTAPYTHIEIDLDSTASWNSGTTHQQAIAVTGLWGESNDTTQVGQLTAALSESGSAQLTMSPTVGVGSLLWIDDEALLVTAKTMVDTAQNLGGDMDAQKADQIVAVTDGTAFEAGEVLLIDAERMRVRDIAANTLIVDRAWDGTNLAAHTTGADIYALASFTVERAQVGTTAASHADTTPIYTWDPPSLLRSWNIAEAINLLQQDRSAWGRTVGSGDNEREASGKGLADIRARAMTAYGRKARIGAV